MVAAALSCPRCHASMRSNRPVPAGTRLKCPNCAAAFVAPDLTNTPKDVPTPPVAANNGSVPSDTTVPEVALPGKFRVAAVLAGSAAFIVLGGALLFFCLRGGEDPPQPQPTAEVEAQPIVEPQSLPKSTKTLLSLTPEDEKKVTEATQKGVAFLKKLQAPDGYWDHIKKGAANHRAGATALAALTLLESGVPKDDPVIQKATKVLRDAVPTMKMTYDLALSILFFDKLGAANDKPAIQTMAMRLVAGQNSGGGWSYICPILKAPEQNELTSILRRLGESKRGALTAVRTNLAASTKRFKALPILENIKKGDAAGIFLGGGGDNSNTQFALLGLWAARRHDVPADPSLALVGKRFRATQNKDGSFSYKTVGPGRGSMTCAGLLGLAVSFGIKEKGTAPPPLQDEGVKDALKYLAKFIGAPAKTKDPLPALYFLWSVERVAVLYQLADINGKRWYDWGVDLLLHYQKQDGHWGPGAVDADGSQLANTCFALLFLQRINLAGDLTDKLREFQLAVGNGAAPPPPFRDDDD